MSSRSRTNSTRVSQIMPLYLFVPIWLLSSRWSRNLAKIVSQQKLFRNKIVKLCEIIPDNFTAFDSMTGNLDRTNPTDWKSKCRTCRFSYWFCYFRLRCPRPVTLVMKPRDVSCRNLLFLTLSELFEHVLPKAAHLGIHFLLSQRSVRDAPLWGTWLRTLLWWRTVGRDGTKRKKALHPAGFDPTTS